LGQFGWSPEAFWKANLREFFNALEGLFELEQMRDRRGWIQMRWQTAYFLNCFTGKDDKVQPRDLVKFDWEKDLEQKEIKIPTPEDFERIKKERGIM
jgi:hypothetical protein